MSTTELARHPATPADLTRALTSSRDAAQRVWLIEPSPLVFDLWTDLEYRADAPRLMSGSDWNRLWWRHYRDLVSTKVCIGVTAGRLTGATLITQGVAESRGPLQLSSTHIGTAGEPEDDSVCVEFNDVLAAPQQRKTFLHGVIDAVRRHTHTDVVQLDGFLQQTGTELAGLVPFSLRPTTSLYTDLNVIRENRDNPLKTFGESTRTNLRRAMKALEPLTLDWSHTADEALDRFDELVDFHQARWTAAGKPGVFSSPRFTAFHRSVIETLVPAGKATVTRLRHGDQTLGCLYLLLDGPHVLYYQAGISDPRSKHSIGILTQYLSLLAAAERGYETFEFMAGDVPHKRYLSTHGRELLWGEWSRSTWKLQMLSGLRQLKRAWQTVWPSSTPASTH